MAQDLKLPPAMLASHLGAGFGPGCLTSKSVASLEDGPSAGYLQSILETQRNLLASGSAPVTGHLCVEPAEDRTLCNFNFQTN